jgi:hypothetical protein
MSNLTMQEKRDYVEARWERMRFEQGRVSFIVELPVIWRGSLTGTTGYFADESEAWDAAYAFICQREEEIRQVDEEIAYLQIVIDTQAKDCGVDGCGCDKPFARTVARLQAIRADLVRGMKL